MKQSRVENHKRQMNLGRKKNIKTNETLEELK